MMEQYEADFERQFDEWIKTQPTFTAKGAAFIAHFKEICRLWYIRGTKSAVLDEIKTELAANNSC